eukprot:572624-Prymnesium_polylepis.1
MGHTWTWGHTWAPRGRHTGVTWAVTSSSSTLTSPSRSRIICLSALSSTSRSDASASCRRSAATSARNAAAPPSPPPPSDGVAAPTAA